MRLDDIHATKPARAIGLLRAAARLVLAVFRSVPEIVWAYLFVRIFGLGPAPAVAAIGLSFAGIIGKLYAELAEATEVDPALSLRASGHGRLGVLLFGVLPQLQRGWSGYALFRLECAVRSAAILGVVGAGGLGSEIALSIRYLQYDRLGTALLALLVCMVLLEIWSAWARKRYRLAWLTVGGLALAGLAWLHIDWGALLDPVALKLAWGFVKGLLAPTTTWAFVRRGLGLVFETLAMAFFATLIAALLAALLAPLASHKLMLRRLGGEAPRSRGVGPALMWASASSLRLVLGVARAVPELVWALLFVV